MSFEEKGTWVVAVAMTVVGIAYFVIVLGQVPTTAVTEIDYIVPMIVAIVVGIGLSIVGMIGIAMASPEDGDKTDERDKQIGRRGDSIGYSVLGVLALVPLGLAMAEIEQFWIANSLYAAFLVTALIVSAIKLVAYRRGF